MAIIDIRTDVTGVVLSIDVEVGQTIAADEAVITLEAMKMHIPVASPEAGRVVEILAPQGELVNEGDVIARLET
jgi:acetyl-CoA carboxylase biotin carboxyl carrier protein